MRFVESVLHPSDFSEASRNAFVHALAVATRRGAGFTIFHVEGNWRTGGHWSGFPAVRGTLERWGLLEEGSPKEAVFKRLGMEVRKINDSRHKVLEGVLGYLERNPTDLIVLATEGRAGMPGWLRPSVAETVARKSETMTLFVPQEARGFVDIDSGEITLRRILVPIDRRPDPVDAITYASRAAALSGNGVEITTLHVGDASTAPAVKQPLGDGCTLNRVIRSGGVVETILGVAEELESDLIVMGTQGHDGILDALRGSVTERVLRHAACPLLAVPAGPRIPLTPQVAPIPDAGM